MSFCYLTNFYANVSSNCGSPKSKPDVNTLDICLFRHTEYILQLSVKLQIQFFHFYKIMRCFICFQKLLLYEQIFPTDPSHREYSRFPNSKLQMSSF